jgi:hypothetical protein
MIDCLFKVAVGRLVYQPFCQLAFLSTGPLEDMSFWQLVILIHVHLANWSFGRHVIMAVVILIHVILANWLF